MPTLPKRPRARSLWLMATGLPLVFASGCPQIASDEFTKSNTPFDTESSGANGGSNAEGAGGTAPNIDLSTATASGSDTSATTSQDGTDAGGSGGSGGNADVDTSTSTETSTTSVSTASDSTTTSDSTTDGGTTDGGTTDGGTTDSGTTDGGTTDGGDTCMEETEICDGLDNDCDDIADDGEVCGWSSGCDGFEIDGRGYMFCGRPLSVDEAETQCSDQGMTLVQIDSDSENDALVAAADERWNSEGGSGGNNGGSTWGGSTRGGPGEEQQPAFWTGGSDVDAQDKWIWTGSETPFWEGAEDGSPVGDAYSNWGDGRPNDSNDSPENCVAVYFRESSDGDLGTWNDLPCDDPYPFICEAP